MGGEEQESGLSDEEQEGMGGEEQESGLSDEEQEGMGGEEQESGLSDEEHQQQADNQHEASIRLSIMLRCDGCISGSRLWANSLSNKSKQKMCLNHRYT